MNSHGRCGGPAETCQVGADPFEPTGSTPEQGTLRRAEIGLAIAIRAFVRW
jgi:hypothetical protein